MKKETQQANKEIDCVGCCYSEVHFHTCNMKKSKIEWFIGSIFSKGIREERRLLEDRYTWLCGWPFRTGIVSGERMGVWAGKTKEDEILTLAKIDLEKALILRKLGKVTLC